MQEHPLRYCPRCGGKLEWVNTIPRFGDRPEIRILKCTKCEELEYCKRNGNAVSLADLERGQ